MIDVIAKNRRARHDYEVLSVYEAGIVLTGTEVKSLRQRRVNLKDSYAVIKNGEAYLVGMHISVYDQGNRFNHDPERVRKLLLNRREIITLKNQVEKTGLTLVPLSIYFKNNRVKVELALVRGRKQYDKRRAMAKREAEEEIKRALKRRW